MKIELEWKEGMSFEAGARSHLVSMDTVPPLGKDKGMSPKELVLSGLAGCTAMDVVAYLKKKKEKLESLHVHSEAITTKEGYPSVFKTVNLEFRLAGDLKGETVMEAVRLSQTLYCGVSAMIYRSGVEIKYTVFINEKRVGEGVAEFASLK